MASERSSQTERPRMPLEERAKIFMPFDPLKGFREALAERERQVLENESHISEEEDN